MADTTTKTIKTRIQMKHDTQANWDKATGFIPRAGEIIIYDVDSNYAYPRIKIGNGTTAVPSLPFLSNLDEIANVIMSLDASDPTASSETSTTFISNISQTDGVINATKKNLPTAGTSLGMVKSGGDVTISSGTITVNDDSHNHVISNVDGLQAALDAKATPANITSAIGALDYTGATASGNATSFITQVTQEDGLVSATKATIPTANGTTAGLVKQGGDVTIASGVITVNDDSHNHVIGNIDDLQDILDGKAAKETGVYFIQGGGATDTTNKVATWTGTHDDIAGYYEGLMIAYKVGTAGSTTTTLNINGLGAVNVVRNATTGVSTAYVVDSIVFLTYTTDSSGTSYWKVADYDSNTKTSTASSNKTGTKMYIVGATSQSSSGVTTYSNTNCYIGTDNKLYSDGKVVATLEEVTTLVGDVNVGEQIAAAVGALDATDPSASGTSTTFISTVSQTDGVISATKASIPTANGTTLGMVKQGGDVTIASGVISVVDDSHNHIISNIDNLQTTLDAKATPADITDAIAALDYSGATASGNATSFITQVTQTDGVINATKASIPIATSSQAGLVKSGTDITVDSSGNVSVNNNSHTHTSANVTDLSTTINTAITNAVNALDASDPTASGTATQFIASISQENGVIKATKANITAAALGLSGAMRFLGTSATAISDGATTNPITIGSTETTVAAGNVVLYSSKEFVWTGSAWEELGNEGSYKVQQSAVSSPTASGNATAFIDTISQNTQGVITVTKKNVPSASTSAAGLMSTADKTKLDAITESADAVSFTQSLTSGTKVGTININGTDTILYAPTNTDTHYTTGLTAGASGTTTNAATSNPYIKVKDDSTHRAQIQLKGSGATTVSSDANGVITISSTDNNTTYSAATSSAAGLMSAADKEKLDGIAAGATANTGDITGVTAGNGLTGGGSSGSVTLNVGAGTGISVAADTVSANLRSTTALTVDSAAATTTSGRVYPVAVDKTGYLAVNVPWVDTNTDTGATSVEVTGTGNAITAASYDASTRKLTLTKDATYNNYTYTLPNATSSTLGGVKVGSNITVSSGTISLTKANVVAALGYTPPTSDTNTTYSAGTGLSLSSTTFNHSNSVTAKTAYGSTSTAASANGGTIVVTDVKYDAQGHITGSTDRTITLSQTTYSLSGLGGVGSISASGTAPLTLSASKSGTAVTLTGSVATAGTSLGVVKTTSTVTSTSGLTASPIIDGVVYYKDTDVDTKNTAGSTNTSSKIFLIGATSQATNPQTYSHDTVYVGTDGYIYSNSLKVNPRIYTTLVPEGTSIESNVDLNTTTYIAVGNYYCPSNAIATTLSNCPTGYAFMMQVFSPLSTTIDNESTGTWVYRIRKLMTYYGIEYVQQVYSGATAGTFTYGEWKMVAHIQNTGESVGSSTQPVYYSSSSGYLKACSTYAGGTAVTLNNSSKAASTASFYAPTTGGTSGYVLTGAGTTSAPTWTAQSSLSVGSATKATQDGNGNVISSTYLPLTGGTVTGETEFNFTPSNESTRLIVSSDNGKIWMGIGYPSGNRGLYDATAGGWIIYADSSNLVRTGLARPVANNVLRNITGSTAALTSGSSALTTGDIYLQYE